MNKYHIPTSTPEHRNNKRVNRTYNKKELSSSEEPTHSTPKGSMQTVKNI
jgi:hypothetical protein